jgi:hypothetical protein
MGGSFPATLTVSDERTDAGPDGATTSASTTKPVAVNRPPNATPDGGAIDICADGTKLTDINVVDNDRDKSMTEAGETVEDQTAYRDQDGDLIGIKSITASDATGMAERAPEPRNKIRYTPPAGDEFPGTTTTDSFSYTLRDQYDATSTADVNVEVANQGGCGNLTVNFVSSEDGPATSTANPLYDGDPLARQTGTSTEWNLELAGTSTDGRLASLLSGPHYDFESGTQGWNTPADSFTTKSRGFKNGQSIGITEPDAPANGAFIEPDALQGGNQIDRFQFYYRETRKSYGGGVQLLDNSDQVVTGVGTDNPQWVVVEPDGGGTSPTRFDTNTGEYKAWTKVTMDFDWSAETVDVTFKRMNEDASTSYTADLQNATNVARIQLDNANNSPFFNGDSNNWYMWYDDISIQPTADAGTAAADDFQIDTPNGFVLARGPDGAATIKKDTDTGQNYTKNNYSALLAADYKAQVSTTNQPPSAQFSYTPSNPTTADTVTFDGSGSSDEDGSIASYSWNGDDGLTGSGATTTHSFSSSSDYQVTLEVEDDNGAASSTSQTVTVDDGCETVALGSAPADQLDAVANQCGSYDSGTFQSSASSSDTVDFTIADIADNNDNVTVSDYELQWLQIGNFLSGAKYTVDGDTDGGEAEVKTHTVNIDGSQATSSSHKITSDDPGTTSKHSALVYEPGDAGLSESSSVNLQGEARCSLTNNPGDARDTSVAYAQAFSIEARFCPNGASDPEPVPDGGTYESGGGGSYEYQQVKEVDDAATCGGSESDQTSLTDPPKTVYTADGTEKELRVRWRVTAQTDESGTGSSSARLKGTRLDNGSVDYDITNDGSKANKEKSDKYETIPDDGDSVEIDEAQASCGGFSDDGGGGASWSVTVEELVPAN